MCSPGCPACFQDEVFRHVHIRLAFSWKDFALLTILEHSRDAVTGVRRFHDNQERCRAAIASNEGIGTTIERSRRNESRPLRVSNTPEFQKSLRLQAEAAHGAGQCLSRLVETDYGHAPPGG